MSTSLADIIAEQMASADDHLYDDAGNMHDDEDDLELRAAIARSLADEEEAARRAALDEATQAGAEM